MKILGVIGSARKRGNCEVLVKDILLHLNALGAEIRALRLSDFKLLPCKGCLACVLKGESCRLDDDMHALWEHLQWPDGIILSAPTYFLGPSGIIKLLIDRLFEYSRQLGSTKYRPGAIIATAGLKDWDPFTLPMLTMLAGILHLNLVDRFVAYRPGPGEVLLDEETMSRVKTVGYTLYNQIENPSTKIRISTPQNACPQCGTPFFQLRAGNQIECQLCQTDGVLSFAEDVVKINWSQKTKKNRWSPEAMAEHFSEWVLPTGPYYQKLRSTIQERISKYQTIPLVSNSKTKK